MDSPGSGGKRGAPGEARPNDRGALELYEGHDPLQFRHYGPAAQEFFAAFGDDGFGAVGTETIINSGHMAGTMMIAIQALEKPTTQIAELQQLVGEQQAQMQRLEERLKLLEAR